MEPRRGHIRAPDRAPLSTQCPSQPRFPPLHDAGPGLGTVTLTRTGDRGQGRLALQVQVQSRRVLACRGRD